MRYYSTNGKAPFTDLYGAVTKGLAPDKGLYMPEQIKHFSPSFFSHIQELSLQEISCQVADALFGDDIDKESLEKIVSDSLNFHIPVVEVEENIYALELFHGPTAAFKDVGARFMARLIGYFREKQLNNDVNVLVATSGDTGSAVANGFYNVDGVKVFVLYPRGLVSEIQERQFTTLGNNITAIEVDGTFDDCQSMVKSAFMDEGLRRKQNLTSANSINVARFLPQSFYYFHAYAQLKKRGAESIVFSVPSGNFGNLCGGLIAKRMGLPVNRFIAANNSNDIFFNYLKTGFYSPKPSVATIANAMDVGDPSNFVRILDMYDKSHKKILEEINGCVSDDRHISQTLKELHVKTGYLTDTHGACGYRALKELLREGETGVFLGTAHPAKFKDTVEQITGEKVEIPGRLKEFLERKKSVISIGKEYDEFKKILDL